MRTRDEPASNSGISQKKEKGGVACAAVPIENNRFRRPRPFVYLYLVSCEMRYGVDDKIVMPSIITMTTMMTIV